MKRLILYAFLTVALFLVTTANAHDPILKREVGGVIEYKCIIFNETDWFIVFLVDGKRMPPLNPPKKYPNMWDGSAAELWLTDDPHKLIAFAYLTQADITNDKPIQKTNELNVDIREYINKKRGNDGTLTLIDLSLEKDYFYPWTTPGYRYNKKHHH